MIHTNFVPALIVAIMAPLVILGATFPLSFRGVGYGAVWLAVGALTIAGCTDDTEPMPPPSCAELGCTFVLCSSADATTCKCTPPDEIEPVECTK